MTQAPDWYNETAKRNHGKPADWRWCVLDGEDAPPGFLRVVGAVPTGYVTRGKNKGMPKFPAKSHCEMIWMTISEIQRVRKEWSSETGKCNVCGGSGETWKRISSIPGESTTQTCRDCGGNGTANSRA